MRAVAFATWRSCRRSAELMVLRELAKMPSSLLPPLWGSTAAARSEIGARSLSAIMVSIRSVPRCRTRRQEKSFIDGYARQGREGSPTGWH